jgi:hypothetical protein
MVVEVVKAAAVVDKALNSADTIYRKGRRSVKNI